MNNSQTIEKMSQMRLLGMKQAFEISLKDNKMQDFTTDEMIAYLIEAEYSDREHKKLDRSIKSARFRYQVCLQEIDLNTNRNLDKNQFLRLSDCSFIKRSENMLITGPTGVGKSYLASALGHQACVLGYKVLYFNVSKLFTKLKASRADQSYASEINKIEKYDLLILDDFGIHPMDNQAKLALLEIIEDRYGKRSTIITSQIPISNWFEIIEEKTIADAILDRIVHQSIRIELKGESLRKIKSENKNQKN